MTDTLTPVRPGDPDFVSYVVARLSDTIPLHRRLGMEGERPEMTVVQWVRRGSIPARWFAPLARIAADIGADDITVEALAANAEPRQFKKQD